MSSDLQNIDIIRNRFKVSYEEARNALAASNGDLIDTLIYLEKTPPQSGEPDLLVLGAEIVDEVQKLLSSGPVRKLKVRYGSRLLAEKPVALTAFAAVAIGIGAFLISRLVIEVESGGEEAASEIS